VEPGVSKVVCKPVILTVPHLDSPHPSWPGSLRRVTTMIKLRVRRCELDMSREAGPGLTWPCSTRALERHLELHV
jgi:hypothetical protein